MLDVTRLTITPSGNGQVDDIVRGLVGLYEVVFPGRIRGYYLTGSYAEGGVTALSDLDLFVVFKGDFIDAEEGLRGRRLNQVFYTARLTPIRLDIPARSERHLSPLDRVLLKLASRPVYGEDIRDTIALPDLPAYRRGVTHIAVHNARIVLRGDNLRGPETLTFPLDYPEPHAEFYGYARTRVPFWYPPAVEHGLKELVTTVGRMATALIALRAGRYVPQRRDSVRLYRECIGDGWTEYVAAIVEGGKERWGYLVPEGAADRRLLHDLCRQTLAFENHFLGTYRAYLLAELRSDDDADRRFAAQRLGEVLYPDEEVAAALRDAARSDNAALRREANAAVRRLEQLANPPAPTPP